ncbi:PLP-dependent aminotransferase family protein [Ensifer sp. HO-A22]|uniref:PLP-dependent aminotransferase family protein n=1 Tax=Ensifer oleiphilus TaxID=2742698 RepID=A0A7Y6UQU6_9HYPH|nr:PLP-dependent aminotransferase family protein [Ensifer oleiphilus]NVD42885.1 PLP-dependent aminotransferase family protein [Ensifer oleiphilus]
MTTKLNLQIDPQSRKPLAEQIRIGILDAIENGVLEPDARLPSWNDLASQLGVARGTVKAAYERLSDEQVVVASPSTGTRVAKRLSGPKAPTTRDDGSSLPDFYHQLAAGSVMFQMGIPAPDTFPAKLFSKLRVRAIRKESASAPTYPDPRGDFVFRSQIAAYLALARAIRCEHSQVFITQGFAGGLAFVLRVLNLAGQTGWVENPSYPISRRALELAGVVPCPIRVDGGGIDVSHGIETAPHAALVLTTPGQQAPLGMTMSLDRRVELIQWAQRSGAWIIEDDYLGEMQLEGRASPALASLDPERVIHIGTFSKTISPSLRLGFIVVPMSLVARFAEAAIYNWPAPGPSVQQSVCDFIQDGHYLRHLRKVRRDYAEKRARLVDALEKIRLVASPAGLAVVVQLPEGAPDADIARSALRFGMAPAPLSPWFATPGSGGSGLLLGAPSVNANTVDSYCERIRRLIDKALTATVV